MVIDKEHISGLSTDDQLVRSGYLLNKVQRLALLGRERGETLGSADSVEAEERLTRKVED